MNTRMWGFFTYYMPTMGSGESGLSRKKYNLSKLESITLWLEICPIFGHLQERKFVQKHKIAEVYPFFPNTKRNGQNLLTTHQSDIFLQHLVTLITRAMLCIFTNVFKLGEECLQTENTNRWGKDHWTAGLQFC